MADDLVSHPRWCDRTLCRATAERPQGWHRSTPQVIEAPGRPARIESFLLGGGTAQGSHTQLVAEVYDRQLSEAYNDDPDEPVAVFSFAPGLARRFIAGFAELLGDIEDAEAEAATGGEGR